MSYVVSGPEAMLAKAADLAGIGNSIAEVNSNIAADTTEVPPAAADQVSALVASCSERTRRNTRPSAARWRPCTTRSCRT